MCPLVFLSIAHSKTGGADHEYTDHKEMNHCFSYVVFLMLFFPVAEASELYFVDAYSQFDSEVDAELILNRMDEGA